MSVLCKWENIFWSCCEGGVADWIGAGYQFILIVYTPRCKAKDSQL